MLEELNIDLSSLKANKVDNRILGVVNFLKNNFLNTFFDDLRSKEKEEIIQCVYNVIEVKTLDDLEIWRLTFRRLFWKDYGSLEDIKKNLNPKELSSIYQKLNSICSPALVDVLNMDSEQFLAFIEQYKDKTYLDLKRETAEISRVDEIRSLRKTLSKQNEQYYKDLDKSELLKNIVKKYYLAQISYINCFEPQDLNLALCTLEYYLNEIAIDLEMSPNFGNGKLSIIVTTNGSNEFQPETNTIFVNINHIAEISKNVFEFFLNKNEIYNLLHNDLSYLNEDNDDATNSNLSLTISIKKYLSPSKKPIQKDSLTHLSQLVTDLMNKNRHLDNSGYLVKIYSAILNQIANIKLMINENVDSDSAHLAILDTLKKEYAIYIDEFALKKTFGKYPELEKEIAVIHYYLKSILVFRNLFNWQHFIIAKNAVEHTTGNIIDRLNTLDKYIGKVDYIDEISRCFLTYVNDLRNEDEAIKFDLSYPTAYYELNENIKWFDSNILLIQLIVKE